MKGQKIFGGEMVMYAKVKIKFTQMKSLDGLM